jgi:hypothetical protein
MSAGGAVAVVWWDFCRLYFFVSFLVKQKRKRENGRAGRLSMSIEFFGTFFFKKKSTEKNEYDFKGNILFLHKQFTEDYTMFVNWV